MAITPTLGAVASLASVNTTLAFAAATQTNGQRIVVAVAILTTSVSVSGISDGTNTFSLQSSQNNGTAVRVELWSAPVTGTTGSRTITITFSGSTLASAAYEEYAGSTAIGNIGTPATGTSNYAESDVVMQDSGSFEVCAIAIASSSGNTVAAQLGTNRQSTIPALTTSGVVLMDNTSTVTATLRCMTQISASDAWAATSLELRTGAAAVSATATKYVPITNIDSYSHHQQTKQQPINTGTGGGSSNSGFVN